MTVKASSHQNGQVLKVERPYYEQEQLNTELSYSKPENNGKIENIVEMDARREVPIIFTFQKP